MKSELRIILHFALVIFIVAGFVWLVGRAVRAQERPSPRFSCTSHDVTVDGRNVPINLCTDHRGGLKIQRQCFLVTGFGADLEPWPCE